MNLAGSVSNTRSGVEIAVCADPDTLAAFVDRIRAEAPAISRIDSIEVSPAAPAPLAAERFAIVAGRPTADGAPTDVSPDAAICRDCLADMRAQGRRRDYPLTNCTLCGPRFTITRRLPYDRPSTTMGGFSMCDPCAAEYRDPADRRFHAQPTSCRDCGPRYSLGALTNPAEVVAGLARRIVRGEVVMVKSLGGYNLMADATSPEAVARLRDIKRRPRRPFAVMTSRPEAIARLSAAEAALLDSWRAPIVICRRQSVSPLAPQVAPGLDTIGLMKPYTGLHHLLDEALGGRPLAVTSANRHGFPIIADDDEARACAASLGIDVATHNRPIHNRVDDSVVRVVAGRPRLLRRSRGYVPDVVTTPFDLDGVMAFGADITSQWALGRGRDAILSQYIGPLTSEGAESFLCESVDRLSALYGFTPRVVAVDAHGAYRSSAIGAARASAAGARLVRVWHHHAHAVAVMAELGLTSPTLALVLDGTGAGPDNTVWGSELLLADPTGFRRLDHGRYLAMPGGDVAAAEPWRMAVSLCRTLGIEPRISGVDQRDIAIVSRMIDRGINSPPSCGAGRLWDAMAALLGLALTNSYEAEAPILLEGLAATTPDSGRAARCSDLRSLIVADASPAEIARRFHELFAERWVGAIAREAAARRLDRVILTGGVLQNDLLATMLCRELRRRGVTPLMPELIPPGDGGLAVGQAVIAAAAGSKRL